VRLLPATNVLSEVTRPRPDTHALQWLDSLDEDRSFISVVSIAEIRRGVALMASGRNRDVLAEWLAQDLPAGCDRLGRLDGVRKAKRTRLVVNGRPDCRHRDYS